MNRIAKIFVIVFALFVITAPVAIFAQAGAADPSATTTTETPATTEAAPAAEGSTGFLLWFGPFGAGIATFGAALGIGRIGGNAVESMARQPEIAGTIQTAMIIAAALIEGFTFYALYICSTGLH